MGGQHDRSQAPSVATRAPVRGRMSSPEPGALGRGRPGTVQAGFDEVYLQQVGGRLDGAFEFFAAQVLPRLREG